MYKPTIWKDHVTTPSNCYTITENGDGTFTIALAGEVMQQGTPQDQTNFNNIELGVMDGHISADILINAIRQMQWSSADMQAEIEKRTWSAQVGTISLENTLKFPFNNSQQSVALPIPMPNINYVVMTELVTAEGNVGEIKATDRLTNGFKLSFDGSAKSATIKYIVIGGYLK